MKLWKWQRFIFCIFSTLFRDRSPRFFENERKYPLFKSMRLVNRGNLDIFFKPGIFNISDETFEKWQSFLFYAFDSHYTH